MATQGMEMVALDVEELLFTDSVSGAEGCLESLTERVGMERGVGVVLAELTLGADGERKLVVHVKWAEGDGGAALRVERDPAADVCRWRVSEGPEGPDPEGWHVSPRGAWLAAVAALGRGETE